VSAAGLSGPDVVVRAGRAAGPAIPDVAALTHHGRAVRFYQDLVRGRLLLVSFTYTRCLGSCPRTGATLSRLQDLLGPRLGDDVFILSITLDPLHDSPEALRRQAEALGARPGWTFVTGAPTAMERLRRAFGFTDPDPRADADRTRHAALLALGDDRTGRWSAVPGSLEPGRILEALYRTAGERPGPPPSLGARQ